MRPPAKKQKALGSSYDLGKSVMSLKSLEFLNNLKRQLRNNFTLQFLPPNFNRSKNNNKLHLSLHLSEEAKSNGHDNVYSMQI